MRLFEGRRAKRLAKLVASAKDDEALTRVLATASAEEIALVLRSLPVERANTVLAHAPKSTIHAALERLSSPGPQLRSHEPACVRALDLAGRFLGNLERG